MSVHLRSRSGRVNSYNLPLPATPNQHKIKTMDGQIEHTRHKNNKRFKFLKRKISVKNIKYLHK